MEPLLCLCEDVNNVLERRDSWSHRGFEGRPGFSLVVSFLGYNIGLRLSAQLEIFFGGNENTYPDLFFFFFI